jgi:hypothetical protein
MSLSADLKNEIYDFLMQKLGKKIAEYSLDSEDASKPFQYALFTEKGYLVKGFIHGCETALGNWHESIALIIARKHFAEAKKLDRTSKLKGNITRAAQHTYENILSNLDSAKRQPNYPQERSEIIAASQDKSDLLERVQTVDLFLKRHNGEEFYLEIKGPKPNKNEMRAAKRDLFEILAMKATEGLTPNVILGMYYNPYYPNAYERWTCLKFFHPGEDFLVGKDFWDFLGGTNTYEDLIALYEKAGEEIRPLLEKKLESLATGY